MDTVVLLQCHKVDEAVLQEYEKLAAATASFADCRLLIQADNAPSIASPASLVTSVDLKSLSFCKSTPLRPGQFFYAVLIYRRRSQYSMYWVIEYDVRYNGYWGDFFGAFAESPADFLTSHLRFYPQEPRWYWWALNHPRKIIKQWSRLRSFNPIYRISGWALDYLQAALDDGWRGHSEVLMPSLLFHHGLHVEDFGGCGPLALAKNKHYIDSDPRPDGELRTGTMRWKPVACEVGPELNVLHHPVKVKA